MFATAVFTRMTCEDERFQTCCRLARNLDIIAAVRGELSSLTYENSILAVCSFMESLCGELGINNLTKFSICITEHSDTHPLIKAIGGPIKQESQTTSV